MKTKKILVAVAILGILSCSGARANEEDDSQGVADWTDYSTTEDGFSPSLCTDKNQQCVFLYKKGGEVTSVTVREGVSGTSELRNLAAADAACKSLKNWGGYSDWRLPTFDELQQISESLIPLFEKYNFINSGAHFFWTSSKSIPQDQFPEGVKEQDPDQYWAIQLNPSSIRQVNPRAAINFICMRNS